VRAYETERRRGFLVDLGVSGAAAMTADEVDKVYDDLATWRSMSK
jgi:hypothetical protein